MYFFDDKATALGLKKHLVPNLSLRNAQCSCCFGVCFVVVGSSKNLASFHGAVFVCGCVSLPRAFSSVSSGGIVAEKTKRVLLTE